MNIDNDVIKLKKGNYKIYHLLAIIIKKIENNKLLTKIEDNLENNEIVLSFKEGIKIFNNTFNITYTNNIPIVSIDIIKNINEVSLYTTIEYYEKIKYFDDKFFVQEDNNEICNISFDGRCNSYNRNFTRGNSYINNLKWLEENFLISDCPHFLYKSCKFDNDRSIVVNFNELIKLKKINKIKIPKKENVYKFINIIKLIKANNIPDIRIGPLVIDNKKNIKSDIPQNINLSFGGFNIFNDVSFNKYKYIIHPGLYIVIYYLEYNDMLDKLENLFEKKVFLNL